LKKLNNKTINKDRNIKIHFKMKKDKLKNTPKKKKKEPTEWEKK